MSRLEFRLLGPLEVLDQQGQRLVVAGGRRRTLLALLLLHVNRVVSCDRLIDGLWGDHPPAAAGNALQAQVASLRRVLDRPRTGSVDGRLLITQPPGYLLRLDADDLDTEHFERLVAAARRAVDSDPSSASLLLADALALWRGPALAEFASEPFARTEAARLEELRLQALEWRVEADLTLGRHAEVVAELDKEVAANPLREGLVAQLMLALYRCGRQADASRVYDAARAVLLEELGMDPAAALRKLHSQILDQDPALLGRYGERPHPAHNLPTDLTSFVGRERELEELTVTVRRERLTTLTGPGGTGKTRLALRLARQLVNDFPDGVWLAELAPLADPSLVAKSVADALGVREAPGGALESLRRHLRSARLLVVLDNCEHVVSACARLAHELLRACEGVRILATSREPLMVPGEVRWPVPGLSLPAAQGVRPPNRLDTYAAIRLFAERAAASRPGFTVGTQQAASVVELCRRLDGNPLAIELAAARTAVLSPEEILGRLGDRFELLSAGSRTAVARHQTLRATLEWSHDLLGSRERALFRRLAVFVGGWSLSHAEAVCADADLPAEEVFDVLCQLVAKSLVSSEPSSSAGPSRYRFLETLRAYAVERLTDSGDEGPTRGRHLRHFVELAERAERDRAHATSGSDGGLELLATEQDNLRAAMGYAAATDPTALLRLATAMEQLWLAGNVAEGRRWIDQALHLSPAPSRERARALHAAGWLADIQQDHAKARALVAESLALSSRLGDAVGEAWAWLTLGLVELTAENLDVATLHLERSRELHQALGDRLGTCRSLMNLAVVKTLTPTTREQGRRDLKDALGLADQIEDRWGEGFGMMFLGLADIDTGAPTEGSAHLRRALMTPAIGPLRAGALEGFAELAVDGDPRRALRLLGAAQSLRERHAGQPPPFIRRRAGDVRGRAEASLDEPVAHEAWDEGCAMSTPDAIGYALQEAAR